MVEVFEARIRLGGRRCVNESETGARDNLEYKTEQCAAAEYVKPAGGFARYPMFHRLANRSANLKARVEPLANGFDQTHGRISVTIFEAVGLPGVGISPALIKSFPLSIL